MRDLYVEGHLRMVEIDQRFAAVMARHPLAGSTRMQSRIRFAQLDAKWQRDTFLNYLFLAEYLIDKSRL